MTSTVPCGQHGKALPVKPLMSAIYNAQSICDITTGME